MSETKTYLVTGGAGFIGSHFARHLLSEHDDVLVINVDCLTYAGSLENIADLADDERHVFVEADICDFQAMDRLFGKYGPDYVVNFAAESSVDRSIKNPGSFTRTNVEGVLNLLEVARKDWEEPDGTFGDHLFLQVSTDEVCGSLPKGKHVARWREDALLAPRNPYSASKASAELYAMSLADTFGLPVCIARCCNNYGPNQHPEKLIPSVIKSALSHEPVKVYGDGKNIREWVHVTDCCRALDAILQGGRAHTVYNIGTLDDVKNINIVRALISELARQTGDDQISDDLITYVEDRQGHDKRYGLDFSKINRKLGWEPQVELEEGICETVSWYLEHQGWLERASTGENRRRNDELTLQWDKDAAEARQQELKEKHKEEKKGLSRFSYWKA